jgi:hypothetical protein
MQLLLEKDVVAERFALQDEIGLLKSFGYNKGRDHAIEELIEIMLKGVKDENIVFFNIDKNNMKIGKELGDIWMQVNILSDDYKHLWIHR